MSQSIKHILRQEILQQRQALSTLEWQTKSNLISDRLQNCAVFQAAKTIFAYFSFRQEVDLSYLFSLDKNWAFPRCVNKSLVWHLWQPGELLILDRYGIKTPAQDAPMVATTKADLILVPSVACDRQGYRLGYGGGFYDRCLSSLESSNIYTIGILFDFAYVPQLPRNSWDIPLNFICTETQFSHVDQY